MKYCHGNIKNEPLNRKSKKVPCEYCSFKDACLFDKDLGNKYRYIKELSNDEVLMKIKE